MRPLPDYQAMSKQRPLVECSILRATIRFLLPHLSLGTKRALRTQVATVWGLNKPDVRGKSSSLRTLQERVVELLSEIDFLD